MAGGARGWRTCSNSGVISRPSVCSVWNRITAPPVRFSRRERLDRHNAARLGKTLWTSGAQGEPIRLYAAFNERDEAEFVCQRIREHVAHGGAHRDAAILYRSNAQSRVFEEILLAARMPYRVYGGLRFFERAEIKDALAYLRLLVNRRETPRSSEW